MNHGALFTVHNDEFNRLCGAVFAAKGATDAVVGVYNLPPTEIFSDVCGCIRVLGGSCFLE
jgi:hypothetical protein